MEVKEHKLRKEAWTPIEVIGLKDVTLQCQGAKPLAYTFDRSEPKIDAPAMRLNPGKQHSVDVSREAARTLWVRGEQGDSKLVIMATPLPAPGIEVVAAQPDDGAGDGASGD